jgi:hypothetical protein
MQFFDKTRGTLSAKGCKHRLIFFSLMLLEQQIRTGALELPCKIPLKLPCKIPLKLPHTLLHRELNGPPGAVSAGLVCQHRINQHFCTHTWS